MKEIHLGEILINKRRSLGITQDDLAAFLGVSKAAVSKWETGNSYPDIQLLPRLAAFFDISIDELVGYDPQLDDQAIRKLYLSLSGEFASLPFDEACTHCREYIRKYYSCWPLLFQIGVLLLNHAMLAPSPEQSEQVVREAMALFERVKAGTDNPVLGNESLQLKAYCLITLGQPEKVLTLLPETPPLCGPSEPLLASALKMNGNTAEAKRVLQTGIYNEVLALFNLLPAYMSLCMDDRNRFEETCRRMRLLADTFHIDRLHPGLYLSCLIIMAQGWVSFGENETALSVLEEYTSLAAGNIYPLRLHGDEYFYLLDNWFDRGIIPGAYPPRDESLIRRSMSQALTDNPAFAVFSDHPDFQRMAKSLTEAEKG